MLKYTMFELYKAYIADTENDPFFCFSTDGTDYPFLSAYISDSYDLDILLTNKYKSFEYHPMWDTATTARFGYIDMKQMFRYFVNINKAKFTELYRMEGIDDTKYSLYNNYDMVETSSGSASINTGSRTDTQSVAPYDTSTFTGASQNEIGAQNNSSTSQNTLTRVGNIGVMTVSDMLDKHDKLFTKYISFYEKIFQLFIDEYFYVGEEVD